MLVQKQFIHECEFSFIPPPQGGLWLPNPMAGRGDDRPLAWSDNCSEAHEAIDCQAGLPGGLAGGRNLQVMSPRVSSGGLPSEDSLGSAMPDPSISSMLQDGAAGATGADGATGAADDTGAAGASGAAGAPGGNGAAGKEKERKETEETGAGGNADASLARSQAHVIHHQSLASASSFSSHVPQHPKGTIPCASREVEHSLLSTSFPKCDRTKN